LFRRSPELESREASQGRINGKGWNKDGSGPKLSEASPTLVRKGKNPKVPNEKEKKNTQKRKERVLVHLRGSLKGGGGRARGAKGKKALGREAIITRSELFF